MAIEVLDSVLPFAIHGFVEVLYDFGASRSRSPKVRIHVFDEHREALRSVADWCRGRSARSRGAQHDPGFAEVHLRSAGRAPWLAIAVVLGESECLGQPVNRIFNVLIKHVRQHSIGWNGTTLQHPPIVQLLTVLRTFTRH